MKETRFFYVPGAAEAGELPADEAQHATRVLRLQSGDEMFLMDGEGNFFRAEVTLASAKRCLYNIKEVLPQSPAWRGHLHLAIAPTKMMERMEWMVEKATEVGCDAFSFVLCRFSERKAMRSDRVEKIVVSAMKQSRKAWKPRVGELCPFRQFVAEERAGRKFIAHCYEEIPRKDLFDELTSGDKKDSCGDDITVLVGPEGDFSIEEVRMAIDAGYESISLGTSRLRTETAGLAAVMMMHLARKIKK